MIDLTSRRGSGFCQTLKIIGLGGAGGNALDRMVLDGVNPASLIAANTDAQALTASVAGAKIQLGREATRGLGSGGDPELGRAAAEEAAHELRAELGGVDAVFLLAGLGGGTGSGAIPVIAEQARDAGVMVIAIVTLPFAFEGKRRIAQAQESLCALGAHADLIVCFENDRMGDGISPSAGIAQAFAAADQTIAQSVAAITALLSRRGLIHLGFDDFKAVLRGVNARCLFGHGEAEGGNRPFDALTRALRNPLMDKGRLLRDCSTVLVQVSGGPEMTLNEVQLLMEEFNRHVDDRARIFFGTAVDPQLAGRIAVTIFSSLTQEEELPVKAVPARQPEAKPVAVAVAKEPIKVAEPPRPMEVEVPKQEAEIQPEIQEEAQEPALAEAPAKKIAAQASLFGDEPIPDEADEADEAAKATEPVQPVELTGVDAARARLFSSPASRVSRPVPGRSLQSSSSFLKPQPSRVEPPVDEPMVEQQSEEAEDEMPVEATETVEASEAAEAPEFLEPTEMEEAPEIESTPEPIEEEAVIAEPEFEAPKPVIPERLQRPVAEPPAVPAKKTAAKGPQQETLKFEPVARGRFEKSEPTIVDGQDLDVPTYLRRNIKIRS